MLNRLDITEEELERDKNILKRKIFTNLCNNKGRVENACRSYYYFNCIINENIAKIIDKIKLKDIKDTMKKVINNKNNMIMVVRGTKTSCLIFSFDVYSFL